MHQAPPEVIGPPYERPVSLPRGVEALGIALTVNEGMVTQHPTGVPTSASEADQSCWVRYLKTFMEMRQAPSDVIEPTHERPVILPNGVEALRT